MMGLAGVMQVGSIPELPSSFRTAREQVPGGGRYDISDVSILNQDGSDQ